MTVTFSVVIPYHNSHSTIEETIISVQRQEGVQVEMIIVDDVSEPSSRHVIDALARKNPQIRVIPATGRGPSAARNTGVRAAKGRYIWFLDADDCLAPNALARAASAFHEDPNLGVVFGRVRITENPGSGEGIITPHVKRLPLSHILGENCVCTASNIAVRSQAFNDIGELDESFVHAEDQEWLVRAFFHTRWDIKCLPVVTLDYRTSVGGLSTDLQRMEAGWRRIISIHQGRIAEVAPSVMRETKARFYRYLARRALRLGQSRLQASLYFAKAMLASPSLVIHDFRRTAATGAVALGVAFLGIRPFRRFTV